MQNRDKWIIEITREELRDALESRIEDLYDKIKLLNTTAVTDTRDAYRIDMHKCTIEEYCRWSRFVDAMEPDRKLFLTFDDYEFFFTDR